MGRGRMKLTYSSIFYFRHRLWGRLKMDTNSLRLNLESISTPRVHCGSCGPCSFHSHPLEMLCHVSTSELAHWRGPRKEKQGHLIGSLTASHFSEVTLDHPVPAKPPPDHDTGVNPGETSRRTTKLSPGQSANQQNWELGKWWLF